MLWVAALDAASYALWYDTTLVIRGDGGGRESAEAIHNAVFGDSTALKELIKELPEAQATRCLLLASTIWHEQRHFVDLLLTNYGSQRFRQWSSLYLNQELLLGQAKNSGGALVCPVDAYADPVRALVAGVVNAPNALVAQGRDVRRREEELEFDRKQMSSSHGYLVELGGHAQLEALAYLFQIAAMEVDFGINASARAQNLLDEVQGELRHYTWPAEIGRYLGLRPLEFGDSYAIGMDAIPSVLMATLMTRVWGQKIEDDEFKLPASAPGRLFAFMQYLDEHDDALVGVNAETAWTRVNEIAQSLFGRSILEEFQIDLGYERENLNKIVGEPHVSQVIKDVFEERYLLRERLGSLLESAPATILDPVTYTEGLRDIVRPLPVQVFPHGMLEEPLEGWKRLIGYSDPEGGEDSSWTWAVIPDKWPPGAALAVTRVPEWVEIVNYRAPLAKLMVKGRSHEKAFGPELIFAEQWLESAEIRLQFEGVFRLPSPLILDSSPLFKITAEDNGVCDICHSGVDQGNSSLISPWFFRSSPRVAEFAMRLLGGGRPGYLRFLRDWSPWVLCTKCTADLQREFSR
jgi:hypothetical protein